MIKYIKCIRNIIRNVMINLYRCKSQNLHAGFGSVTHKAMSAARHEQRRKVYLSRGREERIARDHSSFIPTALYPIWWEKLADEIGTIENKRVFIKRPKA